LLLTLTLIAPVVNTGEVENIEVTPTVIALILTLNTPAIEAKVVDSFAATTLSLALSLIAPVVVAQDLGDQVSINVTVTVLNLSLTLIAPRFVGLEIAEIIRKDAEHILSLDRNSNISRVKQAISDLEQEKDLDAHIF
jgi:hypothetical protein